MIFHWMVLCVGLEGIEEAILLAYNDCVGARCAVT